MEIIYLQEHCDLINPQTALWGSDTFHWQIACHRCDSIINWQVSYPWHTGLFLLQTFYTCHSGKSTCVTNTINNSSVVFKCASMTLLQWANKHNTKTLNLSNSTEFSHHQFSCLPQCFSDCDMNIQWNIPIVPFKLGNHNGLL